MTARIRDWVTRHDPTLLALHRAIKMSVVLTVALAIGWLVTDNVQVSIFASFGTVALLLFADFPGTPSARTSAFLMLVAVGAVLIVLGTLCSQVGWLAVVSMGVVGFVVSFAGVLSAAAAGATRAALLTFILPVTIPATAAEIPARLGGWALAAALTVPVAVLVWPPRDHDALRAKAAEACRALAEQLATAITAGSDAEPDVAVRADAAARAVAALGAEFRNVAFRPVGLTTGSRLLTQLIDQLDWLRSLAAEVPVAPANGRPESAQRLLVACVSVLDACATTVAPSGARPSAVDQEHLAAALTGLQSTRKEVVHSMELIASGVVYRTQPAPATGALTPAVVHEIVYTTELVGNTVAASAVADARSLPDRLLGRHGPHVGHGVLGAAREIASRRLSRELGVAAEQRPGRTRASGRRPPRPGDSCRPQLLGRARHAVGAAHDRARDRVDRCPGAGRDGHRVRCRGCTGAAARHQPGVPVVAAAADGLRRRVRPDRHLVRRGPGRVHGSGGDPVQHHRPDRLAGRAGTDRGRRAGLHGWPRLRCDAVALRRSRTDPGVAGGDLPRGRRRAEHRDPLRSGHGCRRRGGCRGAAIGAGQRGPAGRRVPVLPVRARGEAVPGPRAHGGGQRRAAGVGRRRGDRAGPTGGAGGPPSPRRRARRGDASGGRHRRLVPGRGSGARRLDISAARQRPADRRAGGAGRCHGQSPRPPAARLRRPRPDAVGDRPARRRHHPTADAAGAAPHRPRGRAPRHRSRVRPAERKETPWVPDGYLVRSGLQGVSTVVIRSRRPSTRPCTRCRRWRR